MAFKTDGSSHKNGVKQERDLVRKMRVDKSFMSKICPSIDSKGSYTVQQKGGTRFKEDIVVTSGDTEVKISVKHKKSVKTGSFDWVNTSSAIRNNSRFKYILEVSKNLSTTKPAVSTARKKFNTTSNETMKKMTSEDIRKILVDHVSKPNRDKRMVVTDKTTGLTYAYDFVDDPLEYAINNMEPKFKWGRGKTSAKIVFKDGTGKIYDYGLRGRLVSNNGMRAMVGKSTKNKTSIPVFKIQQDKVSNIFERIPCKRLTII